MASCNQITDAAFANLRGIDTLNMSQCTQITLDGIDRQFAHLLSIRIIIMYHCNLATIARAKARGLRVED